MAIIEITHHILARRNLLPDIVNWLDQHVGRRLGRGDDPVVNIGEGWEILVNHDVDYETGDSIIGWSVDITDEEKSVMFALTWL